jgi:excisionase family DNA binding protein
MTAPSPWLTRPEVAERLRIPQSTLESWAVKGMGPRFAKFGKHVRYRLDDVTDWEETQFGRAS